MDAINVFFANNRTLVYFIGGLSFFAMGLASVLQRRHYSRLRLARWLGLLAWFGILYGFNEWGNMLIQYQEGLPSSAAKVTVLVILQLLARALSLALLFQFGIELLRPQEERWDLVRFLPGALVLLWALALAYLALIGRAPGEVVFSTGDLLARYLLGFPAAVLSCLGLLDQRREVAAAGFPRIARYLLGAAVSLGFFGVVGAALAVSGPFFPGEWLAHPSILYTIGVFVPILRAIDGTAMALLTGRALDVFEFETERMVNEIERRNLLLADRERISRDLHDGIIQVLYAAGLRLEDVYLTTKEEPEKAQLKIRGVMDSLNQVIHELRNYIFDLHEYEKEGSLTQRLADLVRELRMNTMLEAELRVHGSRCTIPPDHVQQLYQITQEALSNIVRHAQARRVTVELSFTDPMCLQIEDDGRGFDLDLALRGGHGMGLRSMQERVALLGGFVHWSTQPGAGTRVTVEVPCPSLSSNLAEEAITDDVSKVASAPGR